MIGKTLNVPNGPQSFTNTNYIEQNLSDLPNIDPGSVETGRQFQLTKTATSNVFSPETYFITENLDTYPRKANLHLYPYFVNSETRSIISIFTASNYDTESEMFRFAATNIKENRNGPVFARIAQNLYATTYGKARILDALQGNTTTAINLVTGREPLIELNNKITVAKTLVGKGIDFLQTVSGVEFPWSEIPGDYLTNPANPINYRPPTTSQLNSVFQDLTGALGSLIGIQRRPKLDRKPSDLLLDYMGEGQKQVLYDNLSYSKYAPNYTTSARSQQSSNVFKFADNIAQGVKTLLGLEAPKGVAYIGDDRGNDVKYAMGDFNDRTVRSGYYLSLMFDPIQTNLFIKERNISEGGEIGGRLVWISAKSKNKLGANNTEYAGEGGRIQDALSTKFTFREDSLMGFTQQLLDTLPTDAGQSRSHVANVIDQTSRVFREGGVMLSRGSAIKYVDKFSGEESGVEFCRVWTKDRPYLHNTDLIKKSGLLRNQGVGVAGSVLSTPYNLNIYPNSNGNGGFDNSSTNIMKGADGFYAKKYMFSIENLAWKTSNVPEFNYTSLPYCERGNNGGRVMWFPPYDLKVSEQSAARWEENNFLGRPEPVYTYQNTARTGQISFKVVVDHPSIMNLLVREHFKGMSDEESDNYINAFFAGCKDLDFYGLIRKYVTLDGDDVKRIENYLNAGKDTGTITRMVTTIEPVVMPGKPGGVPNAEGKTESGSVEPKPFKLFFDNDYPKSKGTDLYGKKYGTLYDTYISTKTSHISKLTTAVASLFPDTTGTTGNVGAHMNDRLLLFNNANATTADTGQTITNASQGYDLLTQTYTQYNETLTNIKNGLNSGNILSVTINITSSTSAPQDETYNKKLSYRRSYSIITDILDKVKKSGSPEFKWKSNVPSSDGKEGPQTYTFKELGYDNLEGNFVFNTITNVGEGIIDGNIKCGKYDFRNASLRVVAPPHFYCRQSNVIIKYTTKQVKTTTETPPGTNNLGYKLVTTPQTIQVKRKPPMDELKRIIMKVLSECYYFKMLEENSPTIFSSLREKLRYFHPAFHSTTPEGLNSRLTFLQQCVRPGDTIPIKGISDINDSSNDMNARNTTFGPPPICVLRVGDFFHSKVVIRDVNITYDEGLWDLNPEGIGVQPMIANVTLQVNFIGGHGLEKPVERLQNALSSNFYANTEMYDYRSTATEDRSKFTKEFLGKLNEDYKAKTTIPITDTNTNTVIKQGTYIGETNGTKLNYNVLTNFVFLNTSSYFDQYQKAITSISGQYGSKITSLFFAPNYRTVNTYTVQTGAGTENLTILGEYNIQKDLFVLSDNFRINLINKIGTTNLSALFSLDINQTTITKTEENLKIYVKNRVTDIVNTFSSDNSIKDLGATRNDFVSNLDKLNFVIETSHDGMMDVTGTTSAELSGFTGSVMYSTYNNCITYVQQNHSLLTQGLDNTFSFLGDEITTDLLKEFLSILLNKDTHDIIEVVYKSYDDKTKKSVEKSLTKFFVTPTPIVPKVAKYPKQKNNNSVEYVNLGSSYVFSNSEVEKLTKVFSSNVPLGNTLNYYKPKV